MKIFFYISFIFSTNLEIIIHNMIVRTLSEPIAIKNPILNSISYFLNMEHSIILHASRAHFIQQPDASADNIFIMLTCPYIPFYNTFFLTVNNRTWRIAHNSSRNYAVLYIPREISAILINIFSTIDDNMQESQNDENCCVTPNEESLYLDDMYDNEEY